MGLLPHPTDVRARAHASLIATPCMRRCYHGPVRSALLVVVLTGCGRFGFGEEAPSSDASAGADATDDTISEAALPQFCDDRTVTATGIPAGDQPIAIRAVALSTGYAVAIETQSSGIPLLELDAQGSFVATSGLFAPGYAPLFGISQHADLPVVSLETGGVGYVKFVQPGWTAYATGPNGDPAPIDPAYAELNATSGIAARMNSGTFEVGRVDDSDYTAMAVSDYSPTSVISGSLVPIPGGARVVAGKAGGVCETYIVSSAGVTSSLHTFSPCYAPKVAAGDATSGVIIHRTDTVGPYAVHVIPVIASDAGTNYPLAGATLARAATREDGAYWIGHGSGSYRALMRITRGGVMTESRENVATYNFDLTSKDAFWIDGAAVHVSTPCLR